MFFPRQALSFSIRECGGGIMDKKLPLIKRKSEKNGYAREDPEVSGFLDDFVKGVRMK